MYLRRLSWILALFVVACSSAAPSTPTTAPAAPTSKVVAAAPTATQAAPAATVAPAPATPTPQPTTAEVLPSPTPSSAPLVVANTGGDGIWIRKTPGTGDKLKAWPDGTAMVVVGPDQSVDGAAWKNVRDPDGTVGWVAAAYLTAATGTAAAAAGPISTVAPSSSPISTIASGTSPTDTPVPATVAPTTPTQQTVTADVSTVIPVATPSTTTATPASAAAPASVSFASVNGARPGQTASIGVQTNPGASCSIIFVPPHGTTSTADGLAAKVADATGKVAWSWVVDARSPVGPGSVTVTCNGASATIELAIG